MSSTLIDGVRSVFTESLIAKFAVLLGEPEGNIVRAIHGAIPMVFTDIVHKSYSTEGTARVHNLARNAASSDFFGQMHEMSTGAGGLVAGSALLNKGTEYAKALLTPHTDPVIGEISRYANIRIPSASFIVGTVAFAALDAVGRHMANSNLDANGLAVWLKTQADGTVRDIPEGLAVKPALGIQHYPWEKRVVSGKSTGLIAAVVVVLIVVIGVILYLSMKPKETTAVVTNTDTTVTTVRSTSVTTADTAAAARTTAPTTKVTLPNGKVLDAYKGGTEDQLVSFLGDPGEKLDKKNGNWFNFTRISFASNSSSLLLESDQQLKNIVAILGAFPKAKIKIGGYSDNTGDSTDNVRLSQQRADNIEAKLKDLGARSSQLAGAEGYGPKYPVGDNGTADGRAMNRRMSLNVKAK